MSISREKQLLDQWRSGDHAGAVATALRLVAEQPESAHAHTLASQVFVRAGKPAKALELASKAVRFDRGNDSSKVNLSFVLVACRQYAAAVDVLGEISSDNLTPSELASLGSTSSSCGDHAAAEQYLRLAVSAKPDNNSYLFNLGAVQRYLGKVDEAREAFLRALAAKPEDHRCLYAISNLTAATAQCNQTAEIKQRLNRGALHWRSEVMLRFALGKELEDLERWDESFDAYTRGAGIQRSNTQYDAAAEVEIIDRIIRTHTADAFEQLGPGCEDDGPIFVLGLPRSGTTLVERILSAHSEVCSLGEPTDFASAIRKQVSTSYSLARPGREEMVDLSVQVNPADLGRTYLQRMDNYVKGSPIFIDKMPLNYLYVGLICRALPNAKIVILDRNPMDSCFAVYKMLFEGFYPWSYDLDEIARYYKAYRRLVDHWARLFPDRIHRISYEGLVGDQLSESRELVRACGLEWQETCISFHKNQEASTTASATQVRQPIYSNSIGRWEKFATQLEPLRAKLESAGLLDV